MYIKKKFNDINIKTKYTLFNTHNKIQKNTQTTETDNLQYDQTTYKLKHF